MSKKPFVTISCDGPNCEKEHTMPLNPQGQAVPDPKQLEDMKSWSMLVDSKGVQHDYCSAKCTIAGVKDSQDKAVAVAVAEAKQSVADKADLSKLREVAGMAKV